MKKKICFLMVSLVLISSGPAMGDDLCATFDLPSNTLRIPCFVNNDLGYILDFRAFGASGIQLADYFPLFTAPSDRTQCATYDFFTGMLHVPCLIIESGSFWMDFILVSINSQLTFQLVDFGLNP